MKLHYTYDQENRLYKWICQYIFTCGHVQNITSYSNIKPTIDRMKWKNPFRCSACMTEKVYNQLVN